MNVYSLPKTLPSADKLDKIIERYKAFRLLSLQLSPESFGSTYEREVAFPNETWTTRVCGALSENIVAVAGHQVETTGRNEWVDETEMLLNREWLASLTLVGPYDREAAFTVFRNGWIKSPEIVMEDGIEWYFILNAMYVAPSARGAGLGTAILEYAKERALKATGDTRLRVLLIVDTDNLAARRTYEKCGFIVNHDYWFDDTRQEPSKRRQATVMTVDIGGSGSSNMSRDS